MPHESVLFLTGATGLVGGGLLNRLQESPNAPGRVFLLVRDPERLAPRLRRENVTVLRGDVSAPGLGLEAAARADLRARVTRIVHCAADTRFSIPLAQARATNVSGTAHVLDLARRCPRLERFAHVSTVYVAGRHAGRIPEAELDAVPGFLNVYQQSKHEAEALAYRAMAELPIAVYRLSTIFGDSETGHVTAFNYTHQLLRLLRRNVLPMVPAHPGAPVDLIPTAWSLDVLAHVWTHFESGSTLQICGGARESITVSELHDLAAATFEAHRERVRMPKLVSLSRWTTWVEKCLRGDDALLRGVVQALGHFLPHFAIPQAFENTRMQAAIAEADLPFPSARQTCERVMRYCLATDWGRRAAAPVDMAS